MSDGPRKPQSPPGVGASSNNPEGPTADVPSAAQKPNRPSVPQRPNQSPIRRTPISPPKVGPRPQIPVDPGAPSRPSPLPPPASSPQRPPFQKRPPRPPSVGTPSQNPPAQQPPLQPPGPSHSPVSRAPAQQAPARQPAAPHATAPTGPLPQPADFAPRQAQARSQAPLPPARHSDQQDGRIEDDWSHNQWPQSFDDPYGRPSYARQPAQVIAPSGQPPRFKRRYDAATYDVPTFNPVRELVNTLGEWTVMLAVVGVVAIVIRVFIFEMFNVPSGSMLNTIQINDKIVANKIAYNFETPGRGDVVVFRSPPAELEYDPSSPILIKRIVGLPGETIAAVDGDIFVNDQRLEEPYIYPGDISEDLDVITLGENEYFMMGDHREDSRDSRFFGPIEREAFIGKTIFTAWPIWNFKIFW